MWKSAGLRKFFHNHVKVKLYFLYNSGYRPSLLEPALFAGNDQLPYEHRFFFWTVLLFPDLMRIR